MALTPTCQLENYILTKLHLDFVPQKDGQKQISQKEIAFDYAVAVHQKEKHRYYLKFHVTCHETDNEENKVGYALETEIVGFFSFNKADPEDKKEKLIRLNGVSILYGILRGIVATTSGNFSAGKFLLPTVMPQDVVQQVEERKAQAKEKNSPVKKRTKKQPSS